MTSKRSGGDPRLDGVSVIVCCHNSSRRLPDTLKHLSRQHDPGVPWEIVVVDNASNDGTGDAAQQIASRLGMDRLRVVDEPVPGLRNARLRGLEESTYSVAAFVDDDNWLEPDWIAEAWSLMVQHPLAGAAGGDVSAVVAGPSPPWLEDVQNYLACGPQADVEGPPNLGYLVGAGLVVRLEAWHALLAEDFRLELTDREGGRLTSGGDVELCYALRLAGWDLLYSPRLRMEHYLPEGRLRWPYLRSVARGGGWATPVLDAYEARLRGERLDPWLFATWGAVRWVGGAHRRLGLRALPEGDHRVLVRERALGRLNALIRQPTRRARVYAGLAAIERHRGGSWSDRSASS